MTEETLKEGKMLNEDIKDITKAINRLENNKLCVHGYWCSKEMTDKIRAMLITEQDKMIKRFSDL